MAKNTSLPTPPRIVLLYGIGGVGKTTVSASLATLAARKGRDTVAFTVDPARRLADSLGISISDDELTHVELNTGADQSAGFFQVAMLHLQTAAKTLVERYSPLPSLADKIITNPVFLAALHQMSNTEECLAWGKAYQYLTDIPMNTMIIDTPPAGSAPSFFQAPDHLLQLLDPENINLITKPLKMLLRKKPGATTESTTLLATFLSGITGKQWLDEARDLIFSLQSFYSDFYHRVNDLQSILRNPQRTTILLITSYHPSCMTETFRIASTLLATRFPLKGIIFNRISPPFFPNTPSRNIQTTPKTDVENHAIDRIQELNTFILNHRKQVDNETLLIKSFLKSLPDQLASYRIPLLDHEITSLKDLEALHPYLIDCIEYF